VLEDRLLIWRFKRGSRDALRGIYEKYLDYLLTLAMALLNDGGLAEDVVHDVFVSLARSAGTIKIEGNLKGYLGRSVVNRVRDHFRKHGGKAECLADEDCLQSASPGPVEIVKYSEASLRAGSALGRLPAEQREAIVLRLNGGMKFAEIARIQEVSVNTVQGRYRYGIEKLRSVLSEENQ
jgi:RNA polymerase sigma-70 factor (ECF subfamily)